MNVRGAAAGVAAVMTLGATTVSGPLAADASSTGLAGIGSAAATAAEAVVSQPGATLFGDTIAQSSVPLARLQVEMFGAGALASLSYPGDVIANAGALVGAAGGPALPPNPAVAKAAFPPGGDVGTDAEVRVSPREGVDGGVMSAHAGDQRASANAVASNVTQGSPGSITLEARSLQSEATAGWSDRGFTVRATAVGKGIALAGGVITIDEFRSTAEAVSDGRTGSGISSTTASGVTVAGVPVVLDERGVRVVGEDLSEARRALLDDTVAQALAGSGIAIRIAGGRGAPDASAPARGIAEADGVIVTATTPDGVAARFRMGGVSVSAVAQAQPDPVGAVSPGPAPPSPSGDLTNAGVTLAGPAGTAPVVGAANPKPTESEAASEVALTPVRYQRRGLGSVGVAGVALTIALVGLLLSYARWQLIDWLSRSR